MDQLDQRIIQLEQKIIQLRQRMARLEELSTIPEDDALIGHPGNPSKPASDEEAPQQPENPNTIDDGSDKASQRTVQHAGHLEQPHDVRDGVDVNINILNNGHAIRRGTCEACYAVYAAFYPSADACIDCGSNNMEDLTGVCTNCQEIWSHEGRVCERCNTRSATRCAYRLCEGCEVEMARHVTNCLSGACGTPNTPGELGGIGRRRLGSLDPTSLGRPFYGPRNLGWYYFAPELHDMLLRSEGA